MQEAGDFVFTPHGQVHRDCVHLIEGDDREVYTVCQHPPTDPRVLRPRGPTGWIESATFTPSEPLRSMCVKLTVPEPPSDPERSLIYLFPGAEDARGSTILQPVLQWGNNRAYGGSYWTIAAWHCTPEGHSRYAPKYPPVVFPGQTIHASVRIEGECAPDSCDWVVEAKVEKKGEEEPETCVRLRVPGLKQLLLFLIGGALEGYSLPTGEPLQPGKDSCPLFPGTETVFRDIKLRDLNKTKFRSDWGTRFPLDVCGFGVEVGPTKETITLRYC